ncbi:MAG: hypothetical protein IJ086_10720 [Clostridium sp.]|nr:hypothetical protein [Clostridium sp.]
MELKEMTKEYIYNLLATLQIEHKINVYNLLLDNNILVADKFMAWVRFKDYITKQQYLDFTHIKENADVEIFQSYDTTYGLIPYVEDTYCNWEDSNCLHTLCDLKIKSIIAEYFEEVEEDRSALYEFLKQNKSHYLKLEPSKTIKTYKEIEGYDLEELKEKVLLETDISTLV